MAVLSSMTGFGAASFDAAGLLVRVEVRAVNHRGLQVKVRASGDLGTLESEVEARVRSRVARGSVVITVEVRRTGDVACVRHSGPAGCDLYGHHQPDFSGLERSYAWTMRWTSG
jgi:hypothetical protein